MNSPYITGWIQTPAGNIPRITSIVLLRDIIGSIKARLTLNRTHYTIPPGLYALGSPAQDSNVFVSANYKLSFDHVRRALTGRHAWILVLDTKGINVWCAAGKGTFGTVEIAERIKSTGLAGIVNHRNIILPQLGAPGVAAREVKKTSGFRVVYGPVRAADIPAFLNNSMKASHEMRQVNFTFYDRFVLTGAEFANLLKPLLFTLALFFLLSGLSRQGFSVDRAGIEGTRTLINILLAYCAGTIAGPLLLPWLPGNSFSLKGFFAGLGMFGTAWLMGYTGNNYLEHIAWLLLYPGISSFLLMNFTGASTYTSLSGVPKEMKTALPVQISFVTFGILCWILARFVISGGLQ